MKKRIILFTIFVLIIFIVGALAWMIFKQNNIKPLYEANTKFVASSDTQDLTAKMKTAQQKYSAILSSETRLTFLKDVTLKLDELEQDLNVYLTLAPKDNKTAKQLSKSYSNLIKKRKSLIRDYNEYIDRMKGDLNADGDPSPLQSLYNQLFNNTVDYLYDYNKCFIKTSSYVFSKVYKVDTVKKQMYSLYSAGVNDLLNNITNNKFSSTILINYLNSHINIDNGIFKLSENVDECEYNALVLNFKHYFNKSNLVDLTKNFSTYYNANIDTTTETSNEKLAIYYAKLILED